MSFRALLTPVPSRSCRAVIVALPCFGSEWILYCTTRGGRPYNLRNSSCRWRSGVGPLSPGNKYACFSSDGRDDERVSFRFATTRKASFSAATRRAIVAAQRKPRKFGKGEVFKKGWNSKLSLTSVSSEVTSRRAAGLFRYMVEQKGREGVWSALDNLPVASSVWDDICGTVLELRRQQNWWHVKQIIEWVLARKAFRADITCYNYLIEAYGHCRQYAEAEEIFRGLRPSFVIPNEATYCMLMGAYSRGGFLEKADALFTEMEERSFSPGLGTFNVLLDVLGKGGQHERAEKIFGQMHKAGCAPSARTYTSMIKIYGKANLPHMAELVFKKMAESNFPPSIFALTALINAYAKQGLYEKAEQAFQGLQEAGLDPDVYAYNALMNAYSRGKYPLGAAEVFDSMKNSGIEPDQASYNILIDSFGRAELIEDAERAFTTMVGSGFKPSAKSYLVLFKGYVNGGQVTKAERVAKDMRRDGHRFDTHLQNSLLHAHGIAKKLSQSGAADTGYGKEQQLLPET